MAVRFDPAAAGGAELPRLTRPAEHRVVAGVAAGIAEQLALPPLVVRATFALLSVLGGAGVLLYAVFWALIPQRGAAAGPVGTRRRRVDLGQALGLCALALGAALLLQALGVLHLGSMIVPVLLVGAGVGLVWRQADDAQRARWTAMTRSLVRSPSTAAPGDPAAAAALGREQRRVTVVRLVGGVILLVAGGAAFLARYGRLADAGRGLLAALVIVLGVVVITGPWWWRLGSELTAERRERIRSQERAEIAAHLHDSVLQTLALIQRNAASPQEVSRLARGQGRELRGWLYRRPETTDVRRLAAAMEATAADIEDAYGVGVETVVVGDAPLCDALTATTLATREALVNAAKHAEVSQVSLFAEVEAEAVTVFVRDRGRGFDPEQVPDGRHGLTGSIAARMTRHGGAAWVRSTPGSGTEIELRMPRSG